MLRSHFTPSCFRLDKLTYSAHFLQLTYKSTLYVEFEFKDVAREAPQVVECASIVQDSNSHNNKVTTAAITTSSSSLYLETPSFAISSYVLLHTCADFASARVCPLVRVLFFCAHLPFRICTSSETVSDSGTCLEVSSS